MRSSILAFGEKALKRIPENQLEADVAMTQPTETALQESMVARQIRGFPMHPAKDDPKLDLERTDCERVTYLHKKPFAEGAQC